MLFDKNQTEFPLSLHRAIWDCGIHILPVEMTLPPEVADHLGPALAESCGQLREFMLLVLSDIYENTEIYLPLETDIRLGIQYRFFRQLIDYALLGETEENRLAVNAAVFGRFKLKNGYGSEKDGGSTFRDRLKMMERAGLKAEHKGDNVIFTNELYPSMFPAMRAMAQIASSEKMSGDNSFMNCDFRKLCPSYQCDKLENALVFLSDEQRQVALALMEIAKKPGLACSVRGQGIHCKHRKREIMDLNFMHNQIILRFRLWYNRENMAPLEAFFWALKEESPALLKYFSRRIHRCHNCKGERSGRCAVPVSICGSPNKLCESWSKALMWDTHVSMDELPYIDKILEKVMIYI